MAVHCIEELVAVEQIDAGQLLRFPATKMEL
jgi:hypothetical protein